MTTLCALLAQRAPSLSRQRLVAAVLQQPRRHKKMLEEMELATGVEKRERLAFKAGIKDPFGSMKVIERGAGTKEAPNLIPSANEARIVGCICHPEQRFAQWMWLMKDMPKRCECGFWFKLVPVPKF